MKNQMLKIFNEKKEYYTKTQRWAVDENGNCVYYDKKTGNRCAIGQMMTIDNAKYLADKGFGELSVKVIDGTQTLFRRLLKKEYKKLPSSFLNLLQLWHDTYQDKLHQEKIEKRILSYINNYKGVNHTTKEE